MSYREAQLEHIAGQIRENVLREPGESVEAWARRTWKMTLEEYEASKPPLPLVQERGNRQEVLLRQAGKPESESKISYDNE